ncbi:MAG: hypothetical protein P4L50_06915, partial [Anaerolineaceae bacterium]|nr:hypothetical protein [Anaerolineaceae bacterium]
HCILEAWLILSSLNVVLSGNPLQSNCGSASSSISRVKPHPLFWTAMGRPAVTPPLLTDGRQTSLNSSSAISRW